MEDESPPQVEQLSYRQESKASARGSPTPSHPLNVPKRKESSTKNDLQQIRRDSRTSIVGKQKQYNPTNADSKGNKSPSKINKNGQ